MNFSTFPEIWAIDFEFSQEEGERPNPICLVGLELKTGQYIRLWEDDLKTIASSPFSEDSLILAYYASSEMGCYLELGWSLPEKLIDLYVEFRNFTNQKIKFSGNGLLGALSFFGIDSIEVIQKEEMRTLALRGGPWSDKEKMDLLNYCQSDVDGLSKLFRKMTRVLNLEQALLRGEYVKAASVVERNGIPIDGDSLKALRDNWDKIKALLISKANEEFPVFDGQVFKHDRWEAWLEKNKIPWERHSSGKLKLDEETFAKMAACYPVVEPIKELRSTLSKMRSIDLSVGIDQRNRCLLSVFSSKTSRNQPSTKKFIFGQSAWMRNLIQPQKGLSLAYIDWSQQEFGIGAALSKDENMIEAYNSGDPYLEFAKQAGGVPQGATKASHPEQRDIYKQCVLAVQYGMGAEALAKKTDLSIFEAKHLLHSHRKTYQKFWDWSDAVLDSAHLNGFLQTVFGWTLFLEKEANVRSIRNFPMQANGAELLRLATVFGVENHIKICALVHDAILIEGSIQEIENRVRQMKGLMERASEIVLDGFKLRSDARVIPYPERFSEPRGKSMWESVCSCFPKPLEGSMCAIALLHVHFFTSGLSIFNICSGGL